LQPIVAYSEQLNTRKLKSKKSEGKTKQDKPVKPEIPENQD
jgi:hypothetical protein